MYIDFLGYFCVILLQLFILIALYDYIKNNKNNKHYDLIKYIKNCSIVISSFILIYISTHLYFKNNIIENERNYIIIFMCIIVLFYWSYIKISWFPKLLL